MQPRKMKSAAAAAPAEVAVAPPTRLDSVNTTQEKPHMSSPEQAESTNQMLRGGAGNVDKIRDILFGTQMRDYESRFARLEETLIKETLEIRETNRRKFEQLETFIRKEFDAVQT